MSFQHEPLKNVIEVHYGKALKQTDRVESGPWPVFGSSGQVGSHSATLTKEPTIIIGRKGSVGEITYAPQGGWAIDTAFYIKIIDPSALDLRYLYYALKKARLVSHTITTSIPGINREKIYGTRIPLPPLSEQKRIAAILDKADAIRKKRQAAIKLADEFLRAVFLDMFGDPVTNPKGWEVYPIWELGKVITGSTPSSQKDGMFGDKIPFITPGDLENDSDAKRYVTEEGAKNSRTVREGSTFVCCIGATIGKVDMAQSFCAFNQQINGIDWRDSVVDVYGYWTMRFLKSVVIKKAITTTLPILKKSIFETIEMPLPPFDLQEKFENVFSKCLNGSDLEKTALEQSELLFHSLTQRAFHGEL